MNPRALQLGTRDYVVAALVSAAGLLVMYDPNVVNDDIGASPWVIPTFLAVTAPVLWRRTAPLHAIGGAFAGLLFHVALFGDEIGRCGPVFIVSYVLAFAAGSLLERRDALVAIGLLVAFCVVATLTDYDTPASALLNMYGFLTLVAVLMWGIGRLVRSRRRLSRELDARTDELRAARDERARLEVATDRARLGAELDELLERRLGKLAALADAGPHDAGSAAAQLAQLEHESRDALEQMRAMVGVLRSDDGVAAVAPPPTLAHLEALVLRHNGDRARVTISGDPRALPAGVELSAYRVVECLLEAIGDAPGVDVGVRFADDALELTVAGPARRRAQAGPAVERARERVQLHRGTLETTTRRGRAETIARLPVGAAV